MSKIKKVQKLVFKDLKKKANKVDETKVDKEKLQKSIDRKQKAQGKVEKS